MGFIVSRFVPAFIFLIGTTVLLCLPGSTFEAVSNDWMAQYQVDKIIHILLFSILVFLFCRPITLKGHFTGLLTKLYLLIAFLGLLYGIAMEFVQDWWVANRSFDKWDILADAIGCYIGYSIAKQKIKKMKPATMQELKDEAINYAKEKMGDKAEIVNKILGGK